MNTNRLVLVEKRSDLVLERWTSVHADWIKGVQHLLRHARLQPLSELIQQSGGATVCKHRRIIFFFSFLLRRSRLREGKSRVPRNRLQQQDSNHDQHEKSKSMHFFNSWQFWQLWQFWQSSSITRS